MRGQIVLLTVICLICSTVFAASKFHYEHLECSIPVDDFNAKKVDTSKVCKEADYFVKIKAMLNSTADTKENDWIISILSSIVTLYEDLKFARSPKIIHLGGHHLNATNKAVIHPISASIPEELVINAVLNKTRPFGLVTYHQHLTSGTHKFPIKIGNNEDIEKAYFVLAQVQSVGWDAPYNVQILARGSLPIHLNLKHCPHSSMTAHPKRLYQNLLKMHGIVLYKSTLNSSRPMNSLSSNHQMVRSETKSINLPLYSLVAQSLLRYTRNVLTTSAMASYILETILDEDVHDNATKGSRRLSWFSSKKSKTSTSQSKGTSVPPMSSTASKSTTPASTTPATSIASNVPKMKVLYLTHAPHDAFKDDFMTDLILHGLVKVLGDAAVTDYPKRDNLYVDPSNCAMPIPDNVTSSLNYTTRKHDWSLGLLDAKVHIPIKAEEVKKNIIDHKYDLIMIASDHHRDEFDHTHPKAGTTVPSEVSNVEFYEEVCRYYKPSEVAYVDGSERHLTTRLLERYASCVGHFFSREGFNDPTIM